MKQTKLRSKLLSWPLGIALVLLCTVAVTQVNRNKQQAHAAQHEPGTVVQNEDSVEVIGTPVPDDPWKELNNLVDAYYGKSGVSYKGTIKVIDDNGEKEKTIEEQPFEYTLVDQYYHYRLDNIEIVSKKDFLLLIDHNNKLMTVSSSKALPRQNNLFDMAAFKKLMLERNAHARVTQLEHDKVLTIDNIDDPAIQGYRIYYSPQTYTIQKILIGMTRLAPLEAEKDTSPVNEGTPGNEELEVNEYQYYVEASFSDVQPMALKVKDFNPENKFIRKDKSKIDLSPAFIHYHLINNLEP